VLVVGIVAAVAIVAIRVFRQRARVDLHGPFDTGLKINASNDPAPTPPAVVIERARSEAGGATGDDVTGRGVRISDVDVHRDIRASSAPPPGPPPPKA
jgi:hypothetical protein